MFRKLFRRFMKPKKEDQARESVNERQLLNEYAFGQLHDNYGLRHAFMGKEPMSREEYEGIYVYGGGPAAYFMAPPYEEYLKLFEKYMTHGYSDPDFYIGHIMG